jgi:DNA primase
MATSRHLWPRPVQQLSTSLDLHDLKSRVDCREIVRRFWGQPKRSTPQRDTYFSRWRNDGRNASFCVTAYGYRDFGGAGEQGSVLDFLQRELNLTFAQAVDWLQDYTNSRPLPIAPRPQVERSSSHESPNLRWQDAAEAFITEAERQLWLREDVIAYLRHKRLLSDETIRAAHLGYHPKAGKINGQFWAEAGIVIPRYQDGRLWLVNVRTITGSFADYLGVAPHAWHGETLDKYLCMAGSKLAGTLFNGDQLTLERPVLFVEGELDCILAQQEIGAVVTPVTLGGATNRLSQNWKQRLLDLNVPIYIALDNDGAGQGATENLITNFGEKAIALKYPAGIKDFTDFLNDGGDAQRWFDTQTSPHFFAEGTPVTWVSAMMNYLQPGAALLFVALQQAARAGAIDPTHFYPRDLYSWMQENGYLVAQASFYRYFQTCENELFSKCNTLFLMDTEKNHVLQNENKSRGRPAVAYQLIRLTQLEQTILKKAGARLYDREFATDGDKGVKARPRIAGLTHLGISNAEAVAAGLDRAYQPIYKQQGNAFRKAERRIEQAVVALKVELGNWTPLKIEGHLIQRQSDLEACIIQTRLKEDEPTSQKEIGRWIGKDRSRVGPVLAKAGYQGHEQPRQVIPIKHGENIKQAAYNACRNGRWCGLLVDDQPEMQPFEQEIANNALKSVALVIQPPYAYTYMGAPIELPEKPATQPKKKQVEQSKAAPEYKPAPYWGEEVNPEVDHNQLVLGLTLGGWVYEVQSGFWIHPGGEEYCRTLAEAVQLQAGQAGRGGRTTDSKNALGLTVKQSS